jgi:hypothetical protein
VKARTTSKTLLITVLIVACEAGAGAELERLRKGGGGSGTTDRLPPSNWMMRSFVALTSLCFALLGCGGNGAPAEGPQTFTISEGETVTYPAGVARAADTIVCEASAGRVGAEVQKPGTGVGGAGVEPNVGGSINVATREDGSVVASCDG